MNDRDKLIEEMERQMAEAANIQRCSLDDAVFVVGRQMATLPGGGTQPVLQGPMTWSWVDPRGKTYIVSESPEREGHAMITIRQTISAAVGAYITTTALLLGESESTIKNSLTLAVVNHMGAYAGYQSTVRAVVEGGTALAGVDHAVKIAGADPAVNSAVAAVLRRETSGDDGDMN